MKSTLALSVFHATTVESTYAMGVKLRVIHQTTAAEIYYQYKTTVADACHQYTLQRDCVSYSTMPFTAEKAKLLCLDIKPTG